MNDDSLWYIYSELEFGMFDSIILFVRFALCVCVCLRKSPQINICTVLVVSCARMQMAIDATFLHLLLLLQLANGLLTHSLLSAELIV